MEAPGQRDDGLDGGDGGAECEEDGFLVRDGRFHRDGEAVALVDDLDDARRGHAAEFVKHGFGEVFRMSAERGLPRAVVRGHGVGERAVAVEDESGEIPGRQLHGELNVGRVVQGAGEWVVSRMLPSRFPEKKTTEALVGASVVGGFFCGGD